MGAKEEMEERHRKKLACFQKTHGGVVKKGDIVQASRLVNSPFTLEELVHMIDVSVNSKYGTDLEGITHFCKAPLNLSNLNISRIRIITCIAKLELPFIRSARVGGNVMPTQHQWS
jgi:hypothetical protein